MSVASGEQLLTITGDRAENFVMQMFVISRLLCMQCAQLLGITYFFYCLQFNGVLIQLTGLNRCSGAALASHTFKYLSQLNSENDMP